MHTFLGSRPLFEILGVVVNVKPGWLLDNVWNLAYSVTWNQEIQKVVDLN